jgi:mono/diheme cytochrome c family protein
MTTDSQRALRREQHGGMTLVLTLCVVVSLASSLLVWGGSAYNDGAGNRMVVTEIGRAIFNGKGVCSTCHGVDGDRDLLPAGLSRNTRENIARLNPAPPDLRQAAALTLTTDKQRFEAIRHGHLRTAMYPLSQETLSDEEILAILPYLAAIRGTASAPVSTPQPQLPLRGDAKNGRQLYHEIGGCAVCHGIDGHLNRRPPISGALAKKLDRLPAPPANLRNPATLRSRNDEDRFRSIKLGHRGTAMYPKNLLRDEDIHDLIAYLATLYDTCRYYISLVVLRRKRRMPSRCRDAI